MTLRTRARLLLACSCRPQRVVFILEAVEGVVLERLNPLEVDDLSLKFPDSPLMLSHDILVVAHDSRENEDQEVGHRLSESSITLGLRGASCHR